MTTFIALFSISTFIALVLTPIVRRLSERFGWLDRFVDSRRVHHQPVSRLGGVAVFVAVHLSLVPLAFIDNQLTRLLWSSRQQLLIALLPAAIVFLLGVYDDFRGSSARVKFVVQALASLLFYALGGRIMALSIPFVGAIELPQTVGFLLTIFWMVSITNAFNLIDGMDGLAAGAALFASLVMLLSALMLGHLPVAVAALVLSGALIGFLRYNFNPASIFLGDSGALFTGFLLAALSVLGTQKASTAVAVLIPLLAFGVPVIDTGIALLRRFISGRPLFQGDREHVHHMLLARGWSQRRVAFVLYGVCAGFGLLALFFVSDTGRVMGLILFIAGAAVIFGIGRLRYHEVDEVKASMKRNLAERRQRVANNIRLRRSIRALSKAATLNELFDALREMLEAGEFVYVCVELGRTDDAERVARLLKLEKETNGLRNVEMRGGQICWSWERSDVVAQDVLDSGRFWSLRLPLSTKRAGWGAINLYRELGSQPFLLDVNYLCDLFQREAALAVERILLTDVETGDAPFEEALTVSGQAV